MVLGEKKKRVMKSIMDRHKYSPYFSHAPVPAAILWRALSAVQIAATRRRSVAMTTAYSVVYLCVYPALCYTHRHGHNYTHTLANIHTYTDTITHTHTLANIHSHTDIIIRTISRKSRPVPTYIYIYSIHCSTVPIANKLIIYEKLVYDLYIYIYICI